eukprot:694962-Lingulodinium_polyedra.AAC.1
MCIRDRAVAATRSLSPNPRTWANPRGERATVWPVRSGNRPSSLASAIPPFARPVRLAPY